MTKMFNEKKAKALELLQKGDTVTSICKEIGISRGTFYNWVRCDKDFIQARERIEEELLNSLTVTALLEAEALLVNGSSTERVQMIQQILKLQRNSQDINLNLKSENVTLDQMLEKTKLECL